jgi:hypothetical protein
MSPQIGRKIRMISEQIIYEDFGENESSVFDIDRIIKGIDLKEAGEDDPPPEDADREINAEAEESKDNLVNHEEVIVAPKPIRQLSKERPLEAIPERKGFWNEICYSNFFDKFDIKYLSSEDDKKAYEESKLRIVRYYVIIIELSLVINFIMNTLTSQEKLQIFIDSTIDQVRFACIMLVLVLIAMSYFVNIKFVTWTFVPM